MSRFKKSTARGINRRYGPLVMLIIVVAMITAGVYLYYLRGESEEYALPEAALGNFFDAVNSYDVDRVYACLDDNLMTWKFYSRYPQDAVENIMLVLENFQFKVESFKINAIDYRATLFWDIDVSFRLTMSAIDPATGERSVKSCGESTFFFKRDGEWKTWFFIVDPAFTNFEEIRESVHKLLHIPDAPQAPSGPPSGFVGETYTYSTSAIDPAGGQVRYYFSWDDGTGDWTEWVDSGTSASASHSWSAPDNYQVSVQAEGILGVKGGGDWIWVEIVENVG